MFRADKALFERINQTMERTRCSSRNKFLLNAVDFYCSYLDGIALQDYLAAAIKSELSGIVGTQMNRLAQLEFRHAVELDKITHIIASICDYDHDQMNTLHKNCVREIKDSERYPGIKSAVEKFRVYGGEREDDN